jgi:hypothetical protein
MFDHDEDEARAYSERVAVLGRQVRAQGIVLGSGLERWVQLAQAVGMDESHPLLRKVLDGVDLTPEKVTRKEYVATLNALMDAMEEDEAGFLDSSGVQKICAVKVGAVESRTLDRSGSLSCGI